MDWTGCELVEVVEGKGTIRGTTASAEAIVGDLEREVSWEKVAKLYPTVPKERLEAVLRYASERLAWDTETLVDWSDCPFVERVAGRCSGAPTVVGTRVFADIIARCHWDGMEVADIVEDYPSISEAAARGMIEYVKARGQMTASAA